MKDLRIKVTSKKFSDELIKEIQKYVDELCKNNKKTTSIAMEVMRKYNCSVSSKYDPESGYIELDCYRYCYK